MGIPVNEQETVINFQRDGKTSSIYTTDSTTITKLNKCVEKNPEEWQIEDIHKVNGEIVGYTYTCPKKYISFRKTTVTRELTPEQKEAAAERMKQYQRNKKS